jgi:hypothetical protein
VSMLLVGSCKKDGRRAEAKYLRKGREELVIRIEEGARPIRNKL